MKTYYDTTFGKRLFVCDCGCSCGRFADIIKEQCKKNIERKCMFLEHNKYCICNKESVGK